MSDEEEQDCPNCVEGSAYNGNLCRPHVFVDVFFSCFYCHLLKLDVPSKLNSGRLN